MAVRTAQFEAFPGSPPAEPFPQGDYLAIRRVNAEVSSNESLWQIWNRVNSEVQALSVLPATVQPMPTRDMIEPSLKAIDRIFASVSAVVKTRANALFSNTYGGPIAYQYEPYAIRWPGESAAAMEILMPFISAGFQVPQVPSNVLDRGVPEGHASTILRPLVNLKAGIMSKYFGLEVKGDISPDELDAIFRGSPVRPPLLTSFDDHADSTTDRVAEDARALSEESAPVPTVAVLEQVQSGKDVWIWVPTEQSWTTFGEILRRMEINAPTQPPALPFPFNEQVVAASAKNGKSAARARGTTTQPA